MTAATLNQSPVLVQTFMGAIYGNQYYAADNGGVNAISIPLAIAPNAYAEGTIWFTKFANTNTSQAVTAQVGSLAALPVVINQAGTLPAIGSIISGMFGMLCYSAAQNKLILLNPSEAFGSFTATIATGLTTTPGFTINYSVLPDGNTVYGKIPSGNTGTSNATTKSLTGIPPSLVTATSSRFYCFIEDNTNTAGGLPSIVTGTTSTWVPAANIGGTGGWTNGGTWGVLPCEFTYTIA